jgi:hypothetical protein
VKTTKRKFVFLAILSFLVISEIVNGQNKYTVNIEQPDPVEAPSILSVSVSNENKNLVVWDQKENENISFFKIYRDASNSTGGWTLIGKVPYGNDFKFIDLTSFPNFRSYNYRISSVDNCGNEFYTRRIHKSIKLSLELNRESAFVLSWSPYEGFDVDKYNIYRGLSIDSMQLLRSFLSNVYSVTDYEYADKNVFYQVEARAKPAYTKNNLTDVNARSNIVSTGLVLNLSDSSNADNLIIFPNPMVYSAMVKFPYKSDTPCTLSLINLNGQTVFLTKVYAGEYELSRGNLEAGLYILQVASDRFYRKKIILGRI